MKKMWVVKMVLFGAVAVVVMSTVVMLLWNWIIPELFHGPVIDLCHAFGLLVLSRILFGGFHKRGRHCGRWGNWKERYEKMSPEQREKMRELWKKRCGGSAPSAE